MNAEALDAKLSRRTFLKTGAAVGGGLLIGFTIPLGNAALAREQADDRLFAPNAFIRIDPRGKITLIMPQVEMGQGIYTGIAMILAEELDVNLDGVTLEAAPPNDALYANPLIKFQVTGGSTSVRAFWTPMRKAGAGARALLVQAAAQTWRVDPAACRTDDGEVIHEASGRRLKYAALVDRAAKLVPPQDPPLKSPAHFKLIGRPLKRLDTPDKATGKLIYGIDARPPGVKIATLASSPVFGGKIGRVDDTQAKRIAGVRQVVVLDDCVAVVADHMWAAKQGLAALEITWNEGANAELTTEAVFKQLQDASEHEGVIARSEGDANALFGEDGRIETAYSMPFLAHAALETMNCTLHVRSDGCEVWVGSQVASRAQAIVAKVTGLPLEKVILHNHIIGGGFGRRLEVDGVEKAARIAQHVDGPLKVIWTREEDIQQDMYRPYYYDRFAARLSNGKPVAWSHRIVGPSILARWAPPAFVNGLDPDAVDGAIDMPYEIPNVHVEYVRQEPGILTSWWRAVGTTHCIFAVESFVERLAREAKADSVAFRRDLLDKNPRLRGVLDLAADKAGWGQPLPARVGRGIALQTVFGTYLATIAEAEVGTDGEVRVRRVTCAVDCGIVINPDLVIAQLQGGLIFGLTAALYGEITLANGRVQQSNFHDYRMMRINETPAIDVHIIQSGEAPGGIGECGTAAAPPALANAIFGITGHQLQRMPIDRTLLAEKKVS